jgi:hypothetical protein
LAAIDGLDLSPDACIKINSQQMKPQLFFFFRGFGQIKPKKITSASNHFWVSFFTKFPREISGCNRFHGLHFTQVKKS